MPSKKVTGEIQQFRNCYILWRHQLVKEDLWVRNGKILNPEKLFFEEKAYADVQIDCGGNVIAPGYIDVQINGALGVDFSCDVEDIEGGVRKVAKGLLRNGVTSFCPTLVTCPKEIYHKVVPKVKRCNGSKDGAGVLGLHLEGPFISVEKKGAHDERYIRDFTGGLQDVLDMYSSLDNVSIVTLAPELERSGEVIQELCRHGVKVSLGHSMADLVQGEDGVKDGANFITHLFNAMLPFHHRDPHLVGIMTSNQIPADRTLFYGLIADGIHTHPAALRIAYRVHPEGLVLVTDAIPAMGLPTGRHHIGSQLVEICGKRATIAGTNTLCGSIAEMDKCVRNLLKNTNCGLVFALESATLHPAQMLGLTKTKGTLEYNTDADFIILDHSLNLKSTYIAGELVWDKSHDTEINQS